MSLADTELMRSASQWLALTASVFCALAMVVASSFAGHTRAFVTTGKALHEERAKKMARLVHVLGIVALLLWVLTAITWLAWSGSPSAPWKPGPRVVQRFVG